MVRRRSVVLTVTGLVIAASCSSTEVTPSTTPTTALAPSTTVAAVEVPEPRLYAEIESLGPDRVLLFGGQAATSPLADESAWVFDVGNRDWAQQGGTSPEQRVRHAMAYVTSLGGVVVYGGGRPGMGETCLLRFGNCLRSDWFADMWLFYEAAAAWEQILPNGGPGMRAGHAMAYDPVSDRLVLFGGMRAPIGAESSAEAMADTWSYDPATNTWDDLTPDVSPPPRAFHRMVYDEAGGRILLWGGRGELSTSSDPDLWAFDVDERSWTPVPVGGEEIPAPRWDHVMVSEPRSGLVVMIGGLWFVSGQRVYGSDVWTLDPTDGVWSRRADLQGFLAWGSATDAGDGTVMVFASGSTGFYSPNSDAWVWLPE